MASTGRPLSKDDVHDLALALPEVELGTSWGSVPTFKVRGKGFLMFREPRGDCLDADGVPMDDVIVLRVSSADERQALLDQGPFFTIDHFRNRPEWVLVRERDLPQLDYVELAEVVTDAWSAMAPAALRRQLG